VISKESLPPEMISNSIFQFVAPENLSKVLNECSDMDLQKGPVSNRAKPAESLYLLVEGHMTLLNSSGHEILQIIPGRSIELGTVLDKQGTWTFSWRCDQRCRLLKIPWGKVEKFFNQDPVQFRYMKRVSTSVAIQKLKNDMTAMGISKPAIKQLIGNLRHATFREALSDWSEKVFMVINFSGLRMRSEISGKTIEVAQFKSSDSVLFDLPYVHVGFDVDLEGMVWFVRESQWERFLYLDELVSYFNIYSPALAVSDDIHLSDKTVVMSKFKTKQSHNTATGSSTGGKINRTAPDPRGSWWPLWLVRLMLYLSPQRIGVVVPSQSGFAALAAISPLFGIKLSIDALCVEFGTQEVARSLTAIKRIGAQCGMRLSLRMEDKLGAHGVFPFIVPLIDEMVVVFSRHGKYFQVSDFSSGQIRLVPVATLDRLRSGQAVLLARGATGDSKVDRDRLPWLLMLRNLSANPMSVAVVVLAGMTTFAIAFCMPLLSQYTIDSLSRSDNTEKVYFGILMAAMLSLVCATLNLLTGRVGNFISLSVVSRLFSSVLGKVNSMDLETIRRIGLSQVVTRLYDTSAIADFVRSMSAIPVHVMIVGVGLWILQLLHPQFFFISALIVCGQFVFSIVLLPTLEKFFSSARQTSGSERQIALEHLNAPQEVHGLDAFVSIRWKWDRVVANRMLIGERVAKITAILRSSSLLGQEALRLALFWIAAKAFLKNEISLGQVVSASMISAVVSESMRGILSTMEEFARSRSLFGRLNVFFLKASPPDTKEGRQKSLRPLKGGELEFRNVSFKYPGSQTRGVLNNISFKIPVGLRVCILGHSGCGKSTIAGLLNRLIEPTSGSILLAGQDISTLPSSTLRRTVGIVEQEGALFAGKIQENISLFESIPDMKRVVEAAHVSSLDEFVLQYPTGYAHNLNYLGGGISQGQKQRILIARMAYLNPQIVVLDEATSHLDPATESIVLKNLYQQFKGRTIIVLTQRVNVARQSDLILHMEGGKLLEVGPHKDLISSRGSYYRFFSKYLSIG
jgi:ABC-type bacteriocin/lantibiotic exporter with double-glycine peptidase domain